MDRGQHRSCRFLSWTLSAYPTIDWRMLISSTDTEQRKALLEEVVNAGLMKTTVNNIYDAVFTSGAGRISPRNRGEIFYFTSEETANDYIREYAFMARQRPSLFRASYVIGGTGKLELPAQMQDKDWLEVLARLRDSTQTEEIIRRLVERRIINYQPDNREAIWLCAHTPSNSRRTKKQKLITAQGMVFTSEKTANEFKTAIERVTHRYVALPVITA